MEHRASVAFSAWQCPRTDVQCPPQAPSTRTRRPRRHRDRGMAGRSTVKSARVSPNFWPGPTLPKLDARTLQQRVAALSHSCDRSLPPAHHVLHSQAGLADALPSARSASIDPTADDCCCATNKLYPELKVLRQNCVASVYECKRRHPLPRGRRSALA